MKSQPKISRSSHSLYGEYSAMGYSIFDESGKEIYSAGNHPSDSQGHVPPKKGVGLAAMRRFCNQTGSAIAKEAGGRWMGCAKIPTEKKRIDEWVERVDLPQD